MARTRVPYGPGDWFLVPLVDGRFAPGRVVLRPSGHSTLSYVFVPLQAEPGLDDVRDLDPGDALLAVYLSGLSIGDTWPLLGGREDFDPAAWPLPEVETEVPFPDGLRLRVERLDQSVRRVDSRFVSIAERGQRQPGGALGAGYLEQWMPLQLERGALRPVREQVWWQRAQSDGVTGVPGGATVDPDVERLPDLVVVVLPGPEGSATARSVERRLRRRLRRVAEVDGTLAGPEGGEVWVYADDVTRTVEEIRAAVRRAALPRGAHLRVRTGDDDPVRVDLR